MIMMMKRITNSRPYHLDLHRTQMASSPSKRFRMSIALVSQTSIDGARRVTASVEKCKRQMRLAFDEQSYPKSTGFFYDAGYDALSSFMWIENA